MSPGVQHMAREVLGHWTPLEHTPRALHASLHPDDCNTMAAWLRSNHRKTLQPVLRVGAPCLGSKTLLDSATGQAGCGACCVLQSVVYGSTLRQIL